MLQCSRGLRETAAHATTFDEAATAITGFLFSRFADPATKETQCVLVRFYKTSAYHELDSSLKAFARAKLSAMEPTDEMRVLTLVASAGIEPEWNDPKLSLAHRAIPLPSVEIVEQAPMIAGLIEALGLEIADIVMPSVSLMRDTAGKSYNVFHVEHAPESALIPAQAEFVRPYGIRSVIGFGGLLPSGELFAIVMFSKVTVRSKSAARFRSVALDVKANLHRLAMVLTVPIDDRK
jgi:hypothetical protein